MISIWKFLQRKECLFRVKFFVAVGAEWDYIVLTFSKTTLSFVMEKLPIIICDGIILAAGNFGVAYWKKNKERLVGTLERKNRDYITIVYNTIIEFHLNEPYKEEIDDESYRKNIDINHMRNFSVYEQKNSHFPRSGKVDVEMHGEFNIKNIEESECPNEDVLSIIFNKRFIFQNEVIETNYIHGNIRIS